MDLGTLVGRSAGRFVRTTALLFVLSGLTHAQLGLPPLMDQERQTADEEAAIELLQCLPRDPAAQTTFFEAQQDFRDGAVSRGLAKLQLQLDSQSDFFISTGLRLSGTLREQVDRILLTHRDEYERLMGGPARQLLDEALSTGDTDKLVEVLQRFEWTDAGALALERLARFQLSAGEPQQASTLYRRLASHPNPQLRPDDLQARLALAESQTQGQGQSTSPPGRIVDWRTPYGNAQHMANAPAASPLEPGAWRHPLIDEFDLPAGGGDPNVVAKMQNREAYIRSQSDRLPLPVSTPLILGDAVIVPGYGGLRVYDIHSGELRWPGVIVEETFDHLFVDEYSAHDAPGAVSEELEALFFVQRGWRDATAASISADRDTAYAVVDCNLFGAVPANLAQMNMSGTPKLPDRQNTLIAYDLRTGMLRNYSSVDPADFDNNAVETVGVGQQGGNVFFYSAPLPVNGLLYVIGEERGQIMLFELDPASGLVQWSLPLLNPTEDLMSNESRRLSGLMPAYKDGLLICPTGSGVLIAVDVITHRLVWAHQYHWTQGNQFGVMAFGGGRVGRTASTTADRFTKEDRWRDHRLVVTDDRVLFTPPDDYELVCLKLADGKPAWSDARPQVRGLYIAGVHAGHAIIVDQHDVMAIRLSDGLPAWAHTVSIPAPSGRGVIMGNVLVQPLTRGTIAAIELDQGQLLAETELPEGFIAGNLVAAHGRLLTQTASEVVAFKSLVQDQAEINERLAKADQKQAALVDRARLKFFGGDVQGGIDDLREALTLGAEPDTRNTLVRMLLSGLRSNFDRFSRYSGELEALLETPEQRTEFLKAQAQGLKPSDPEESLQRFLILLGTGEISSFEAIDGSWSARLDAWTLGNIEDLVDSAEGEARDRMLDTIREWQRALFSQDLPRLLKLTRFVRHDLWDTAVLAEVAAVLPDRLPIAEASLALHSLRMHPDPLVHEFVHRKLLDLALQRNDLASVDIWLKELQAKRHEPDDTTQQEIAALRDKSASWPRAWQRVQTNQITPSSSLAFPLPVYGPVSPELAGWTFSLEQAGNQIVIQDAAGMTRRIVPTSMPPQQAKIAPRVANSVFVSGSRACIILADRLFLIDLLDDALPGRQSRELVPTGDNVYSYNGMIPVGERPIWGIRGPMLGQEMPLPPGHVGPLLPSVFCHGLEHQAIGVDALSNEEVWRARGLPAGAEIVADAQYTVLLDADNESMHVLRTVDGKRIASRPLPAGMIRGGWRRADWGRLIPTQVTTDKNLTWSLHDPATGNDVWSREFPAGTIWAPVNGRDVAFLTPDGQLTFHRSGDGEEFFQEQVGTDLGIATMQVLDFADQWIVVTATGERSVSQFARDFAALDTVFAVNGPVLAVDKMSLSKNWQQEFKHGTLQIESPKAWPVLMFTQYTTVPRQGPPTNRPLTGIVTEIIAVNRYDGQEIGRVKCTDLPVGRSQGQILPTFEMHYRKGGGTMVLKPADHASDESTPNKPE